MIKTGFWLRSKQDSGYNQSTGYWLKSKFKILANAEYWLKDIGYDQDIKI